MSAETVLKLKPCPFCNSHAKHSLWSIHNYHRIQCEGCEVEMDYFLTQDAAYRWWNTRTSSPDCSLAGIPVTYVEYVTQPAESLAGIAHRQLRDESRWIEVRDLNAQAFPDMAHHSYYPVGTKIKLPSVPASPSSAAPTWICANDRLPGNYKADYLIFCSSGEVALSEWIYDRELGWCFWYDPDASHWQPLPSAPCVDAVALT